MAETVLGAEGVPEGLQGKLVIIVPSGTPPDKLEASFWDRIHDQRRPRMESSTSPERCPIIAAEFQQSMIVPDDTEGLPAKMMETTQWIFQPRGQNEHHPPGSRCD
jgi:hypothetical protein